MKLEPVAWHVKDKTDFFTMWKPIARQWILDGFDVVEMFPAIPEGYVVVPKEVSGKMWSAGRDALRKVIDAYEESQGYELRSAILDRGPEKIHEAMIAAGE